MTTPLPHSPAAERNQAPILAVLQGLLGPRGRALEIASGTGQHAVHFAAALRSWHWQPTDVTDAHFAAIRTRALQAGATNVAPPRRLDVLDAPPWPSDGGQAFKAAAFDLIHCANLLHISPWACCAGLMRGAAHHLAPGGLLAVYGPFIEADVPTAPSNLAFDADLKCRDPAWGLRPLDDVLRTAEAAGLRLAARHALPANNLLLVLRHD
jgi:SAM-dependent methyltransferase